MMDEKMKAAFDAWCVRLDMDDDQRFGAVMARVWTLEYLRSQQEPVGVVVLMPGTSEFTMACFGPGEVPAGTKLYAHPVPSTPAVPKEYCS